MRFKKKKKKEEEEIKMKSNGCGVGPHSSCVGILLETLFMYYKVGSSSFHLFNQVQYWTYTSIVTPPLKTASSNGINPGN